MIIAVDSYVMSTIEDIEEMGDIVVLDILQDVDDVVVDIYKQVVDNKVELVITSDDYLGSMLAAEGIPVLLSL